MEKDIEKLKFPIGKYKAILEFNFSRTVQDIKTLESFSKKLKEAVKGPVSYTHLTLPTTPYV